jgi:probable HAF family extracellular repeat protein
VSHGFLLSGGTFTAIDVPGAQSTTANDINNAGVIVGTFVDSSGKDRSYIRSVNGSFSPLDVPGAAGTRAEGGINNHGDIVGDFDDSKGNTHGFLFHDGSFTTVDVPGAKASFAIGINDLGVIAGAFDPSAPNQFRRGFLAEPIPEPATLLSLCVGLAASIGLVWLRRRQA